MRAEQRYKWQGLSLGVCYYPEHWDRRLWRDDLRRMRAAGLGTVRVAEFAWSLFEPREGDYSFELFDAFMDLCEQEGMRVILGTPTATPPAWLTEKYPEALNCRIDGAPYRHGMRRHYNYNSPVYQRLCAGIVEALAARYAGRRCVVGWQIDNELNCETDEFYSDADTLAFRQFLREKYGSLDALNDAWGTVVWSQTYGAWEEIYVPRLTIHNSTNPHQMLDYRRFVSESAIRFCRLQSDILRRYVKPGDFITTNGMFASLDNHRLADMCLDVYTYDSYPNFAYLLDADPKGSNGLNDRAWSRHLARVRSICPHFGVMEQQAGANGWNTRMEAPAPKPGQLTLWALQSIAHGADYVGFFRWRTAPVGTEIYWHGILDYDNRDTRRLSEVKRLGERLRKLQTIGGADYAASVGLLDDYDNAFDASVDAWHRRLIEASGWEIFAAAQLSHTPLDSVHIDDDTEPAELSKYAALFYPHPLILTEARARTLAAYVEGGGTLILGARAGQKDIHGRCPMAPMPGPLAALTGSTVREFSFVGAMDEPARMEWDGVHLGAGIFNDALEAEADDARILASYSGGPFAGCPALALRRVGKGRVLHFGGTFERETVDAMLAFLGVRAPWEPVLRLPEACEIAVRERDGERFFFVLNYGWEDAEIEIRSPLADMDDDETVQGTVRLKPFEVRVYRMA